MKIKNPISLIILIFVPIFGSMIHLMYGNYQTSKWHFIVQEFYMRESLPKWVLPKLSPFDEIDRLLMYDDKPFTGSINTWYENGQKRFFWQWKDGYPVGTYINWNNRGQVSTIRKYEETSKNFVVEHWSENGTKIFSGNSYFSGFACGYLNDRPRGLQTIWGEDGAIKSKEYYNSRGDLLKKEIYKNNELVEIVLEKYSKGSSTTLIK